MKIVLFCLVFLILDEKIRVVGSGHSWAPIAVSDHHLISLDEYGRVLELMKDKNLVRVQAGIRLKDLNVKLERLGFSMFNLGTVGN